MSLNDKIAVFDSGMGGLSVLNFALKAAPYENFLYYADKKNVPYGLKSREQILKFTSRAVEFLISNGAKAVVIACNTATSAAINELRAKFNAPIIGMEPAVKKAADEMKGKDSRALVIATPITVAGAKLRELILRTNSERTTDLLALPRLVEFAENENFNGAEVKRYLSREFANFKLHEYSHLVLGCTHFNYFKDTLREILPPSAAIIDGVEGTINRLISELKKQDLDSKFAQDGEKSERVKFYYSGELVSDENELAKINRYLTRLDAMAKIC